MPPYEARSWTRERAHAYLDRLDPTIAALFPDHFEESELGLDPGGVGGEGVGRCS